MEFFRKNKLKDMGYIDRCRLASCYGIMGDKKTGKQILPALFSIKYFPRELGGSFDSVIRRLSLYLMTLCEVNKHDNRKFKLAKEITTMAAGGHFGTTQDNVFALMALAKAYEEEKKEDIKADIFIHNKLYKTLKASCVFKDNKLSGKTLTLKNPHRI